MNTKYLETLELNKILERLASYTSFSAGHERALALCPSNEPAEVRRRQRETAEAKLLLSLQPGLSLGGARDVRPMVRNAEIGAMLDPQALLDVQATLLSGKTLRRAILPKAERFPTLADIAQRIEECPTLVTQIARCINGRGEVMDSASPALVRIRHELAIARDRLLDRLNRLISSPDNAHYLQEALITQRSGRYVIPLKAEFKGRIPGIVHDQSASGATLFIEPLAIVELGNQWRQLQLDEQREIERILRELTVAVAEHAEPIRATVQALAELDLAFAKANYAFAIKAVEPDLIESQDMKSSQTSFPEYLRLLRARHPLLPVDTVVPIDVHLGGEFAILVITGPNTGGKTVALKTVGLLAAMAQCGLQIPAMEGSALRVFSGLFADIGDEQSIEQSLSTFSSHMGNIVAILAEASEDSLVLLDELGAGTDPTEGSALARAILSELLQRRIPALITTHYNELKLFAQATPGVENASVEFDVRTLSPTYKLTIGLPGRSNAFAIARRLGLPQPIIEEAKKLISAEDVEADRILERIRRSRHEIGRATYAAQSTLAAAREKEKEARRLLREAERERRQLLAEARAQLELAQEELRRIRETIERQQATRPWLEEAEKRIAQTMQKQKQMEPPQIALEKAELLQEPLAVGDTVWISSLNQTGQIIALGDGDAEVQVGLFRAKVPILDLEKRQPTISSVRESEVHVALSPRPMPSVELSLRGMRVEEALSLLNKHLDDAYLASLPYVRIVHGKGTGTLRKVVRETLAEHPLVASFKAGELNEGGEGVTIVKLVPKT